jgi:tetratricopeptide (TPR) repeat protein
LLHQGRLHEAKAALEKSLNLRTLPGFQSEEQFEFLLAKTRGELAVCLGHFEDAVQAFGQQLTLLSRRYGQYSLNLGLTLERLVYLLDRLGHKKQAREYKEWSRRLA